MLDLYDELGRRQRTIRRFARALFDQLRVERGTDRGSESLIQQTAFLGFAFLGYERGVAASGADRRARLRRRLLRDAAARCRSTTSSSRWRIIRRIPAACGRPTSISSAGCAVLRRIDVVVTDETHDAGFRDRLERELPGIEERSRRVVRRPDPSGTSRRGGWRPVRVFVSRDREEELREVARADSRARRATSARAA